MPRTIPPPRRPLDLAQPFVPDVHPFACDCPACDDAHAAPVLIGALLSSTALVAGGVIAGQLLGRALQALGILAALGIG